MTADANWKPWFEKYPLLFKEQTDILKSSGFELDMEVLQKDRRVLFRGRCKADPERQLFMAFPDAFPSSAPQVFDTPESKLLPRHHRIDTRQLCLFGFNQNRWDATKSATDVLTEVEELITTFKDWKSGQGGEEPEPITRAIRQIPGAAVLVPPPISTFDGFLQLKPQRGKFILRFVHEGDHKLQTGGRGVISQAVFGGQKYEWTSPFSQYLGNKGQEIYGDWFYLQKPPTQEDLMAVVNHHVSACRGSKKAAFYWLALIFEEESSRPEKPHRAWLVIRANHKGEPHLIRTFPYVQDERFARVPGLDGLEAKRITLIGCGTLGSKIAANLAASGVNQFNLVDCDYFEPNNSVRHELGVENFGLDKAPALLNRLGALNPAVIGKSKPWNFQVATISSGNMEKDFFELVRDSDLVIDAAGMHAVSHFLNELSFKTGTAALFASITNGAWGGEIVRVIPRSSPCWLCWLDQYHDKKPPTAPIAEGEVFPPGCDQPTFTGTTYDAGFVANLATSIAVDTLLARNIETAKHYLRWSGKDANGSPLFLTEFLPMISQQSCPLCGSGHGI